MAIDLVSGKHAIARLSAASKEKFGTSFSPMSLCRQMSASAMPPEVSSLLDRLVL